MLLCSACTNRRASEYRANIPCMLALGACCRALACGGRGAVEPSSPDPVRFHQPGREKPRSRRSVRRHRGRCHCGLCESGRAARAEPERVFDRVSRPAADSPFLERGRLSGTTENVGLDTVSGPLYADYHDPNASISYLAGVYASPQRKWAISGFRHQLARVQQEVVSMGVFQQDPTEITSRRERPQSGVRELSVTSYAVAGAIELSPHVSIGGTLNVYTFDLQSDFRRFETDGFSGPPLPRRRSAVRRRTAMTCPLHPRWACAPA